MVRFTSGPAMSMAVDWDINTKHILLALWSIGQITILPKFVAYEKSFYNRSVTPTFYIKMLIFNIKGRFPEFRMYPNFANLFSKFLGSTVYKEISKLR